MPPTGYSITSYGDMITDRPRMDAYHRALAAAIRPGCHVLDIGAGTGIFSLLACRLGAGEVSAVEPNAAIEVARQLAAANGFTDRIRFHQALSTEVRLPQRADVIVSDLRGVLPLFQHHIRAIVDARSRLLAPGGTLIPRRDTLWAALVDDAKSYRSYVEPWLHNDLGLDLRGAQPFVVNSWRKVNASVEQLLVAPQPWATLEYAVIELPNVAAALEWTLERPGTAHGILVWFDTDLGDGIGFSNAPGAPGLIYGQAFFPLQRPVEVEPGDTVAVSLRADLSGDDYTWQWRTRVVGRDPQASPKASYHQSTFFGAPLAPGELAKREARFRPALSDAALVDRFVLERMDGTATLMEIAAQTRSAFPLRFSDDRAALGHVGWLSQKHAR